MRVGLRLPAEGMVREVQERPMISNRPRRTEIPRLLEGNHKFGRPLSYELSAACKSRTGRKNLR